MIVQVEVAGFLWRGQITRDALAFETVCLPKEKGGLGIPFLRAKCDALLLMQAVRMLKSRKSSRDHLSFWIGKYLPFLPDMSSVEHTLVRNRRISDRTPDVYLKLRDLILEAKAMERLEIDNLEQVTTKGLYLSYIETIPPAPIEDVHPEYDWEKIWSRSIHPVLSPTAQSLLYLLVHERVSTKERGFRLMPTRFQNNLCSGCWKEPDTMEHRYCACELLAEAWEGLRETLTLLHPELVHCSNRELLSLNFPAYPDETRILWLLGSYLEIAEKEVVLGMAKLTRQKLTGILAYMKIEARHVRMPELGFIPGLDHLDNG